MGSRTLAYRAFLIGLDTPCEITVFRMLACLAYACGRDLTQDDCMKHKATIRAGIKSFVPTRTIELPLTINYGDTPADLDGVTRASAYGTSLPREVCIR